MALSEGWLIALFLIGSGGLGWFLNKWFEGEKRSSRYLTVEAHEKICGESRKRIDSQFEHLTDEIRNHYDAAKEDQLRRDEHANDERSQIAKDVSELLQRTAVLDDRTARKAIDKYVKTRPRR